MNQLLAKCLAIAAITVAAILGVGIMFLATPSDSPSQKMVKEKVMEESFLDEAHNEKLRKVGLMMSGLLAKGVTVIDTRNASCGGGLFSAPKEITLRWHKFAGAVPYNATVFTTWDRGFFYYFGKDTCIVTEVSGFLP